MTQLLKNRPNFVIAGVLLLALFGCQSAPTSPDHLPDAASKKELIEFQNAQNLFLAKSYKKTLEAVSSFEKKFPSSPLAPQIENLRGLSLLAQKKYPQAAGSFELALNKDPSSSLRPYYLYNLASAQAEAGKHSQSLAVLKTIRLDDLNSENQLKALFLKAKTEIKLGLAQECLSSSLEGLKRAPWVKAELRPNFSTFHDQCLSNASSKPGSAAFFRDLVDHYRDTPEIDPSVLAWAKQEIQEKNLDQAKAALRFYLSRFKNPERTAEVKHLLSSIEGTPPLSGDSSLLSLNRDSLPIEPTRIGILLPLSGKFGRFGLKTLQGIEHAFGLLDFGDSTSYELFIEDPGEEADSALRAFESLVKRDRVVAVIGPISSKGIEPITQMADKLGVPLLNLTRNPGFKSPYNIQAGLSSRVQAHAMARFAVTQRGIKRFAIVYPNDKGGQSLANDFWSEVAELGGEIRGYESYSPGETDFRQVIDRLVGLYYTESRGSELAALAREREANKVTKRTRKTEKFYSLPPLVDFDAVFIADEPKVSSQIIPTFAYRDVDKLTFLGNVSWNTTDFLERQKTTPQMMFFLDAFIPGAYSDGFQKSFVADHKRVFKTAPSSLEAIGFDAGLILKSALEATGRARDRAIVLENIMKTKDLEGVTGLLSFKDNAIVRDLKILTIQSGKITAVDP